MFERKVCKRIKPKGLPFGNPRLRQSMLPHLNSPPRSGKCSGTRQIFVGDDAPQKPSPGGEGGPLQRWMRCLCKFQLLKNNAFFESYTSSVKLRLPASPQGEALGIGATLLPSLQVCGASTSHCCGLHGTYWVSAGADSISARNRRGLAPALQHISSIAGIVVGDGASTSRLLIIAALIVQL